jgi:hypothetical protein
MAATHARLSGRATLEETLFSDYFHPLYQELEMSTYGGMD